MKDIKELKSFEEILAETYYYRNTFGGRTNIVYHSIRRWIRSVIYSPRKIKWAYQRMVRGYSDADVWNADTYLAGQIAGIMRSLAKNGNTIPTSYGHGLDEFYPDTDIMLKRRNADYDSVSMTFAEYHTNGPAYDESWKNEFGGVLDKDMEEALQWLVEHFQELWD